MIIITRVIEFQKRSLRQTLIKNNGDKLLQNIMAKLCNQLLTFRDVKGPKEEAMGLQSVYHASEQQ